MAKKVVLAGACRTAIGTMGGTLSTTPAPELGAIVIKEALKRAGVAPEPVQTCDRAWHWQREDRCTARCYGPHDPGDVPGSRRGGES